MKNFNDIYYYLKAHSDYSDSMIAGIMANIQCESAGYSDNLENRGNNLLMLSDEEYTERVDNGTITREKFTKDGCGYGLCQWTYSTRKQALYDYARAQGVSIGNMEMQVMFLIKELTTNYKGLVSSMRTADAASCAKLFMVQFERPADISASAQNKRAKAAESLAEEIKANKNTTGGYSEIFNLIEDEMEVIKESVDKISSLLRNIRSHM